MSRLSDRLNEAKPSVSIDAAIERARADGHTLDRSVYYKALKGRHAKNPSENTLAAFAAVFGIPVTELRELVGKPAGELGPYEPPSFANRLTGDQRRALNEFIRTVVDAGRDEQPAAPIQSAAARRSAAERARRQAERDAQARRDEAGPDYAAAAKTEPVEDWPDLN